MYVCMYIHTYIHTCMHACIHAAAAAPESQARARRSLLPGARGRGLTVDLSWPRPLDLRSRQYGAQHEKNKVGGGIEGELERERERERERESFIRKQCP